MAASVAEFSLITCTATCPLAPGVYLAPFHDPFTITIDDPGWQQEPTDGSDVVVLSRTSNTHEQLAFYPGPTIPIADLAALTTRLMAVGPGIELSEARTLSIGGEPAVEVDATPTGSQPSSVSVAGNSIAIRPDRTYRFTLAQQNMLEEGALHLIVAEAPKDRLAQFLPLADRILETLGFF